MRILIIDDETELAYAIKDGLTAESFAVDVETSGEDGYNAALYGKYDLILLDVMMPIMNGYEVCENLRKNGNHTPILMLTAKNQIADIVGGLSIGADDYLVKPFSFDELIARIHALLRRPKETVGVLLCVGDLSLDTVHKVVKRGSVDIQLSSKEFALLEYLLRNKNKTVSKDELMDHVWDFDADILPNTVEVFINYVRAKIEKPFSGPKIIKTVRGFGYMVGEYHEKRSSLLKKRTKK